MPKSNNRKNTKLHCKHCAKPRTMMQFLAINTEQQDGEKNVYPFKLKKFLDLIQRPSHVKLPRFYVGTCATCFGHTFYEGQNHKSKLNVLNINVPLQAPAPPQASEPEAVESTESAAE